MILSEEKVEALLKEIIKTAELKIKVRAVVYRKDYQDYFVVVGKVHYCDIREKLINDYTDTKHTDFLNEIIFKMKNAIELEEWQKDDLGLEDDEISDDDLDRQRSKDGKGSRMSDDDKEQEAKKKIEVDDSDKFDWLK